MKANWARTKGETVQHIYCINQLERISYPIRLCNWSIPNYEPIEIGEARKCKYCEQHLTGKRKVCFAPKIIELVEKR